MWSPSRSQQARVAERVRDLLGEQPSVGGSHRRAEFDAAAQRMRWEPSRAVISAVAVLVVVVALATFWWYQSSKSPAVPVSASGSSVPMGSTAAAAPTPSGTSPPSEIVVDVAGKVLHPGVYHLPPDARVDDAVRAAGGPIRGVSTVSLNLAAPLHDGDEVVVGIPGAPAVPAGASGAASAAGPLDLNTATAAQLDALPGVGPVLAQHIIDWRTAHGGFTSVSQLQQVSGIGDAKFADLKPLVTA